MSSGVGQSPNISQQQGFGRIADLLKTIKTIQQLGVSSFTELGLAKARLDVLESQQVSTDSLIDSLTAQVQNNLTSITVLSNSVVTAQTLIATANAAIAALQAQIAADEALLAGLQDSIDDIYDVQIIQLQASIAANTTLIEQLTTRVETAEADINTNEGLIADLRTDITTAQDDITTLQSDLDTDEGTITTMQGTLDSLQTQITTATTVNGTQAQSILDIIDINQAQTTSISTLDTSVTAINALIPATGVTPTANQLTTLTQVKVITDPLGSTVAGHTSSISTLNTNVSTIAALIPATGVTPTANQLTTLTQVKVITDPLASTVGTQGTTITTQAGLIAANTTAIATINTRIPSIGVQPTVNQFVESSILKDLLDTIFPIGTLQMTNGAQPNTYNGYMVWTLYSTGDNRYLKCFGGGGSGGSTAGTLVSQQNLSHTHSISTIVVPSQTITTGNNTVFTATSTKTDGTFGTNQRAMANTNGNGASSLSTLTFTPHTHQVVIPAQSVSGATIGTQGGATLECNAIFVAIYQRTS